MRQLDRSQLRRRPRPVGSRSAPAAPSPSKSRPTTPPPRSAAESRSPSAPRADASNAATAERLDDDRLLALAHARAPGVEALLFRRLSSLVNRLVWRLLGPDTEYQDTTHDAFIRIFRGIPGLRDAARLEEWAARVTINTVKNVFRRRALRKFIGWDSKHEPDDLLYHPDFEHRELLARTYRILDRLPADERVALTLDWFEPLAIHEMAARIGVSTRTIKRRLKAARARFRRAAGRDPVLAPWLEDRMPEEEP